MADPLIVRSAPATWMRIAWPLVAVIGVLLFGHGIRALFFSEPVTVTIACDRAAKACTWSAGAAKPESVALDPGARFDVYRTREFRHSVYCPVLRRANGVVSDVGPRCVTAQVPQMHAAMDRLEGGLESGADEWSASYVSSYELVDVMDDFGFGFILVMFAATVATFGATSWARVDPVTQTITIEYGLGQTKKTQVVRFDDVVSIVPRSGNVELFLTAGRVVPLSPSGTLKAPRTHADALAKLLRKPLREIV